MRRLLLVLLVVLAAGVTWWAIAPKAVTLDVEARYPAFGAFYPRNAAGLTCPRAILAVLARCAPADRRPDTFGALARALEQDVMRVDLGFAADRSAPAIRPLGPSGDRPTTPRTLPADAVRQLRALPSGYLVMRFEPAMALTEISGRRYWPESGLAGIMRDAPSATVAVGEDKERGLLLASLALDYRTAEEAEAVLARLTAHEGYVAQPFARTLVRRSRTVTILYQINADLALQLLSAR